jgi:hypothetical protein
MAVEEQVLEHVLLERTESLRFPGLHAVRTGRLVRQRFLKAGLTVKFLAPITLNWSVD